MDVSISLPPDLVAFLQAKVETGRYGSVSEVVGEALRLLERVERGGAEERDRLRRAWEEGVASGDAGPLGFDGLTDTRRRSTAAAKG